MTETQTQLRNFAGQLGMAKRKIASLESEVKCARKLADANRARASALQTQLDATLERLKKHEDDMNLKIARILSRR